jgi:hypothetical protein
VLQATVDLPRFPSTLVMKDIGECVEVALVEFDTAVAAVGDVGRTPQVRVNLTGGRIVAIDRGEVQESFLRYRRPPLVFRYHRRQEGTFRRRLLHTDDVKGLVYESC